MRSSVAALLVVLVLILFALDQSESPPIRASETPTTISAPRRRRKRTEAALSLAETLSIVQSPDPCCLVHPAERSLDAQEILLQRSHHFAFRPRWLACGLLGGRVFRLEDCTDYVLSATFQPLSFSTTVDRDYCGHSRRESGYSRHTLLVF